MNAFTIALTFVIIWWLILFMVLPFGASPLADEEVTPGQARSAPAKPRMLIKILITTALAAVVTAALIWFLQSGLVQLRPSAPH
jgi:predicted secreted protein